MHALGVLRETDGRALYGRTMRSARFEFADEVLLNAALPIDDTELDKLVTILRGCGVSGVCGPSRAAQC